MFYYRFSLLAKAWAVLHPLQISLGFGWGGEASPFPLATPLVLINNLFFHGSILCLILLIETFKFDYIFPKLLLKLVYSFMFSSCQIWTMCAQVKSFLTLRLWLQYCTTVQHIHTRVLRHNERRVLTEGPLLRAEITISEMHILSSSTTHIRTHSYCAQVLSSESFISVANTISQLQTTPTRRSNGVKGMLHEPSAARRSGLHA